MYYNWGVMTRVKKDIHSSLFSVKKNVFFNFFKKVCCLFLVSAMFFNIFVTKSQEFKDSFFVALNCAVNTIESNFFNKHIGVVNEIINGIMQNLQASLIGKEVQSKKTQKEDKNPTPVNSSSDNAILIKKMDNSTDFSIKFIKSKLIYSSIVSNDLYILYNSAKTYSKGVASTVGILFFILFAVLIARIKDTINNYVLIKNIETKEPAWLR